MAARLSALCAAIGFVTATASRRSDAAGPDVVVEPLQIDSVEVRIVGGSPPRAVAHVEGVLGDGCSTFHSLSRKRAKSTVTLTILRQRPRSAMCTQIARLYAEDISLQGAYPAGRYLLVVNGVERSFSTP